MSSSDTAITLHPVNNSVDIRASPRVLNRKRETGFNSTCGLGEVMKGYKKISVETHPHSLPSAIFYASDRLSPDLNEHPYTETEFVTVDPATAQDSLVFQDDNFEIDVMGMSVAPFDIGFSNDNELLVYSLKSDKTKDDKSIESVPYIHFDPLDADEDSGSKPNRFIPIPATKSLFMSYNGKEEREKLRQVFCRFFIMEIDQGKTSQTIKHSISGISRLGSYAQKHSSSIPEFGVLAPVLNIASEVGKRALHSYTKADKVLAVDFRFLLSKREDEESQKNNTSEYRGAADYLRYGYYYFLDRAVDGKLYANTSVSSQNLPLKLRRVDNKRRARDDSEYVTLTGVSYLVMKVSRGRKTNMSLMNRQPVNNSHGVRIKKLLEDTMDEKSNPQDLVERLAKLAKELGISKEQ